MWRQVENLWTVMSRCHQNRDWRWQAEGVEKRAVGHHGETGSTCLQSFSTRPKKHISAKHQLRHWNPPLLASGNLVVTRTQSSTRHFLCSGTSFKLLRQQTVLGGLSTPPDLSGASSTAYRMGILQAKEELGNISHTKGHAVIMRGGSDIRMLSSNLGLAPSYQD